MKPVGYEPPICARAGLCYGQLSRLSPMWWIQKRETRWNTSTRLCYIREPKVFTRALSCEDVKRGLKNGTHWREQTLVGTAAENAQSACQSREDFGGAGGQLRCKSSQVSHN
eukprot:6233068-Amphidinium_carterae.1